MVYLAVPIGKSGKYTLVDRESLRFFDSHRWCAWNNKASSGNDYVYAAGTIRAPWGSKPDKRKALLHRLVVGATAGQIVDHANGDTLDNRAENLRICTHTENMRNRRLQRNKTGYPGVAQHGRRFIAVVVVDGVRHKRAFATPEEAHACYLQMKNELHGQFAGHKQFFTKIRTGN